MDYIKIVEALTIIQNICVDSICDICPFILDDDRCGITDSKPGEWDLIEIDKVRVFK